MNLKDMGKILSMASSGEMQTFIAKFQAELDGLTQDRMALRQAFPQGFVHFNKRMDSMEAKLDAVLSLLTAQGANAVTSEQPTEQINVGSDHINGTAFQPADPARTASGGGK